MAGRLFRIVFIFGISSCTSIPSKVLILDTIPENYQYKCSDNNRYSVAVKEAGADGSQKKIIKKNSQFKEEISVPSYLQGLTMLFDSKTSKDNKIMMKIENVNNFKRSNVVLGDEYTFVGVSDSKYSDHWTVTLEFKQNSRETNAIEVKEVGIIKNNSEEYRKYKVIRKINLKTGFDDYFEYISDDEKTICQIYKN